MKRCVENVCLLESIQLNLAVTHLVVDALQLVVQLQLLPFELTVLLLVPGGMEHRGLLDAELQWISLGGSAPFHSDTPKSEQKPLKSVV